MIAPYYSHGGITLYCGACENVVPLISACNTKFNLLLSDPPYGIKRDKGFEGFEGFGGFGVPIARRRYEDDDWDSDRPTKVVFDMLLKTSEHAMLFGGNFFADLLPQGRHWIFWDKLQTMPTFGDGELIWTNIERKSVKKITQEYNGLIGKEESRFHPTQKPLDLLRKLILEYSAIGDIIFDPFCGSGTTLRAAKDCSRRAVGIERLEKYCEIAARRLSQECLPLAAVPPLVSAEEGRLL